MSWQCQLERVYRACIVCAVLGLLQACSDAQSRWRLIEWSDAALRYNIPCKPQASQRVVPLAGSDVSVSMQGCMAKGVMFAIATARLHSPEKIALALDHWRLASVPVAQATASSAASQKASPFQVFLPNGALQVPQSLQWQGVSHDPHTQQTLHVVSAWFAAFDKEGAPHVYAVTVYSAEALHSVAQQFLEGISLL